LNCSSLIDVTLGALTVTGFEMVWVFMLRLPWAFASAATLRRFDSLLLFAAFALVAVFYHLLGIMLGARLATRSLRRPADIWRRLFPAAAIPLLATYGVSFVEMGPPIGFRELAATAGGMLVALDIVYALMWGAAYVWRRAMEGPVPARLKEGPPLGQRVGVQIWLAVLVVGILLALFS